MFKTVIFYDNEENNNKFQSFVQFDWWNKSRMHIVSPKNKTKPGIKQALSPL